MGYIARKDKVDRAGEVIAVLQKEWTLFRKEHREALIDGDLRLVGFNLAEVRIDGRIEHETVVQDELGVQADLGLHGLAVEKRMVRVAVIDVAKAAQQSVGNELNVAGRRNAVDPGGGRSLIEPPLDAIGDSRPKQILIGARNAAVQNDPPLLFVIPGEPQALKGNFHEQQVALVRKPAFGIPNRIERGIKAA